MKTAENRAGFDRAVGLNRPMDRCILVQSAMCPQPIIVGGILAKVSPQMSLAHGQSFPYWQLFGINDPDNDLITKYEFMDATASATSGHFVLNGVVQPAGKAFSVLSADISTLS
jgi:hypothetical protein